MNHNNCTHPRTTVARAACRKAMSINVEVVCRIAPESECVQAELHVDAHGGRCACGWVANKDA